MLAGRHGHHTRERPLVTACWPWPVLREWTLIAGSLAPEIFRPQVPARTALSLDPTSARSLLSYPQSAAHPALHAPPGGRGRDSARPVSPWPAASTHEGRAPVRERGRGEKGGPAPPCSLAGPVRVTRHPHCVHPQCSRRFQPPPSLQSSPAVPAAGPSGELLSCLHRGDSTPVRSNPNFVPAPPALAWPWLARLPPLGHPPAPSGSCQPSAPRVTRSRGCVHLLKCPPWPLPRPHWAGTCPF